MKCPFCGTQQNRVIDSRLAKDGRVVRRRRECDECVGRFTTYERVEEILPMVVKKGGARSVYDRDKVLAGIRRACQKRPVSVAQIDRLVDDLERELHELQEKEIPSTFIGERVLERLRDVDGVAYVRFASVYRDFRTVEEFLSELHHIQRSDRQQADQRAQSRRRRTVSVASDTVRGERSALGEVGPDSFESGDPVD